ncbi:MAG: hypothetical protein P0Y60_05070 [Candidatus Microbacterium colombiense]|nr:MAG: hypothetical protein P0Y60_05070 [Microbacterium sp.]
MRATAKVMVVAYSIGAALFQTTLFLCDRPRDSGGLTAKGRERDRREARRRWDDRILEKSARLIQLAEEATSIAIGVITELESSEDLKPVVREMDNTASYLSLVVTDDLRMQLGEVVMAAFACLHKSEDDLERAYKVLSDSSNAYDAAVRKHFGLTTGKKRPARVNRSNT